MAVFQGELYVASSKYRLAGSSLSESQNPHLGGGIYRLGNDDQWIACGRLSAETEAVGSLVVFQDRLYAGRSTSPPGSFGMTGRRPGRRSRLRMENAWKRWQSSMEGYSPAVMTRARSSASMARIGVGGRNPECDADLWVCGPSRPALCQRVAAGSRVPVPGRHALGRYWQARQRT